MVYFDNAATTFKKPKNVYRAVSKCIRDYSANPGRSGHKLSLKATEAVYDARERIAAFFHVDAPENVVFTYNATYALNMAIKSMINHKCHVLISDVEHNSVLRPIAKLSKTLGIEYSVFKSGAENIFREIEGHIRDDTEFVVSTLVSNVTGAEIPLLALSEIRRKHKLKVIVDASQAAGHMEINLSECKVDAMAMPGHKGLFGIMGSGLCIFDDSVVHDSFIEGGSGNESMRTEMPDKLPEGLEAGTLGVPGIISVSEGIKFINNVGIQEITEKINLMTDLLKDRILSCGGKIYGANNGVISFSMNDRTPGDISRYLDECGICTRSGLHCSPLAHKSIGTLEQGTVRASLSYFNNISEIDKFYKSLRNI